LYDHYIPQSIQIMNDDLQSFIEPELEARLVALILGEASAFEVEELDRILKKRPEVALAKQRLEEAHGLLGQAMGQTEDDGEWKLSTGRREKVLAVFSEGARDCDDSQSKERRISIAQWRSIHATAASLMVAVVVLALVAPMHDQKLEEPELLAYSANKEFVEREIREQEGLVRLHKKELNQLVQDYGIPYFEDRSGSRVGQSEEQMYRRAEERLDQLELDRDQLQGQLRKLSDTSNDDLIRTAAGLELPENKVSDHFAAFRKAEEKASELSAGNLGPNHPKVRAAKLKAETELASATKEVESMKDVLETRLALVDKQVDKMATVVREKKSGTVDFSLQQHRFSTAKEEYEQSRMKLREMKLKRGRNDSRLSELSESEENAPASGDVNKAERYLAAIEANLGEPSPDTVEPASRPAGIKSLSKNESGQTRFGEGFSNGGLDVSGLVRGQTASVAGINGIPNDAVKFDWAVSSQSFNDGKKKGDDRLWYNFSEEIPDSWDEFVDGGGRSEQLARSIGRVTKKSAEKEEVWNTFDDLPAVGSLFKSRVQEREDESGKSSERQLKRSSGEIADESEVTSQRVTRAAKPKAPSSSLARVIPPDSKSKAAASMATAGVLVNPELPSEPGSAKPDSDGDGFSAGYAGFGGGGASRKKVAKELDDSTFPVTPATPTFSGFDTEVSEESMRSTGNEGGVLLSVVDDGVFVGEELVEKGKPSGKPGDPYRAKQEVVDNFVSGNEGDIERMANARSGGLSRKLTGYSRNTLQDEDLKSRSLGMNLDDDDFDGLGEEQRTLSMRGAARDNVDFISPDDPVMIPGIPSQPIQGVSGIATAGLRSGTSAVSRNWIDSALNAPSGRSEAADSKTDEYFYLDSETSTSNGKKPLLKGQGKQTIVTKGEDSIWGSEDQPVIKAPEPVAENPAGDLSEREVVRRSAPERLYDNLLLEGRSLYAKGDYESAVQKYRESLEAMPPGNALEDRRKIVEQHLADGSVALATEARRTGQFKEARKLLEEVIETDSENINALKGLLEMKVDEQNTSGRTSGPLSPDHAKKIDEVRRNLYKGNGYYDLGLYDKAEEEFKEVLKLDPYNKAARRWLEKTAAIKSDYYRAAYDSTRANMLMEVDQEWELALPPVDESEEEVGESEADEIVARRFSVPANFESLLEGLNAEASSDVDPFASDDGGSGIQARKTAQEILKAQGLMFPDGASASFLAGSGELVVRNTPENLELMEQLADLIEKAAEKEKAENTNSYGYWVEGKTSESASQQENFRYTTEAIPLYGERQGTVDKLKNIVIPELDLQDVTIEEAMTILEQGALANDLEGEGLKMDVRKPRVVSDVDSDSLDADGGLLGDMADPSEVKIDKLYLKNVPLEVAARYVADKAKLRYKVDDGKVTFLPLGSDEADEVVTRRWTVPTSFEEFIEVGEPDESDPFYTEDDRKGKGEEVPRTVLDNLKMQGVVFSEGASASYLPESRTIIVRNTPTQLELVNAIVQASLKDEEKQKAEEEAKILAEKNRLDFETLTSEKTDSTFSLNVSDVSFKLAKSSLSQGKWPEAAKVRPEEFVNALDYDDRKPSQSEKVACKIEQGAHPFMQQRNLMRVSMSTAALGRNASTPLRLTILLDQSGSMERADRAESVKRAFSLLTDQLKAGDEVTLVGFARTPRLLAERVKGNESKKLLKIVSQPLTEGGTNLEGALKSGIQLARQQFVEGAQNRIILLTDGAANLGDALPANLAKQVEEMRKAGIAFDACGVGADGLNDEILSSLAKQGDGRYYFLDRPEDADEGFARQIAGALRPAAKNVKVQVIFNPKRVSKFKLYGFKKHRLKKEDFRNDTVDAAEMAAEESGVALYHFEALPEGEGDVGHISVRFLDTATDRMVERKWTIPYEENATGFSGSAPALRLAGTAALFAEKLKGSAVGERVQLKELRKEADSLQGVYQSQARFQELRAMLQQAGD